MRHKFYLAVGAGLACCFSAVNGAVLDNAARSPFDAQVVTKTASRSFTGSVQSVDPGGVIRLREHMHGDVQVIVTKETSVMKGDRAVQLRDIHPGTRLHGMASFRGGKYYAKVVHLD